MKNSAEPIRETVAYVRYEWDCPSCPKVYTIEAHDLRKLLTCRDCGQRVRIAEAQ